MNPQLTILRQEVLNTLLRDTENARERFNEIWNEAIALASVNPQAICGCGHFHEDHAIDTGHCGGRLIDENGVRRNCVCVGFWRMNSVSWTETEIDEE